MDSSVLIALGAIVFFILMILSAAIKIVQEYERGVIFRLGRLMGARGPGLILLIPFIERMEKVDLRILSMDVPRQEVITRDNVTINVNAVVYFRVVDPNAATVNINDHIRATSQIAQTTLRSVLGQVELDQLLAERDEINQQLQVIIDEQTEPWGVKVSIVEVKDVELPQVMQRAMARQAEAEREKRAKVIHAEGEFMAAAQLHEAAEIIAEEPIAIQLRYLQTLTEISSERNSTIIFPLPMDLISSLVPGLSSFNRGGGEGSSDRPSRPKPPTLTTLTDEKPKGRFDLPDIDLEDDETIDPKTDPIDPRDPNEPSV